MNDEQTSGEGPSLDKSDPTNAKLATLMVKQTGKVLQNLARIEKLVGDPSTSEPALCFEELRGVMERALREDREYLPEHSRHFFPSGTSEGETLHTLIRLFAHVIDRELCRRTFRFRRSRDTAPSEPADPEAELEAEEPARPVVDYIPVSWEEYGERIKASLAKSAKKEQELTAMLDGVMAAGLLATSDKGSYVLALAELFGSMISDDEPLTEIPEGWAPVVLAINPMTGEFLTIAGPRSEPDGRVEAVETMVARLMQNSVAGAVSAVREAGRAQPKTTKEGWPMTKPRGPAQPRPTLSDVSPEKICEVCEEPTSVEVAKRRVAAGKVAYWPGVYLADGRFGHLECLREDESEE